jgi:transposase-like protein
MAFDGHTPRNRIIDSKLLMQLLKELEAGARQVDLCKKYGLHQSTVSNAVRKYRQGWKPT